MNVRVIQKRPDHHRANAVIVIVGGERQTRVRGRFFSRGLSRQRIFGRRASTAGQCSKFKVQTFKDGGVIVILKRIKEKG